MRYYDRLFIWENRRHVKQLYDYRNAIFDYYNYMGLEELPEDPDEGLVRRSRINMLTKSVHDSFRTAKIAPFLSYDIPRAGIKKEINVIDNVFNINKMQVKPVEVVDFIDRAIGVYTSDRANSIIRTLNPFFWLILILEIVVRSPFYVLRVAGFNQKKMEESFLGRLTKGVIALAGLAFTVVQIAEKLGYIDNIKKLISGP